MVVLYLPMKNVLVRLIVAQPLLYPFAIVFSLITSANVSSFRLLNKRFYDFVIVFSLFI